MTLLLLHAGSTWFMLGLIWFVQVVHYPLAGQVPAEGFVDYQLAHMQRTAWVVGPPMLLEAATTALLLLQRPPGVPSWAVWLGAALLAGVWISTALLQVPAHEALTRGLDSSVARRLVDQNWIRTVLWTVRGLLAFGLLRWAWSAASGS